MQKNALRFPVDLGCLCFSWIYILGIALGAEYIIRSVSSLGAESVLALYLGALFFGTLGAGLLLIAHYPRYRQRDFLFIGTGKLDRTHRILYWSAYAATSVSIVLFIVVWLKSR